MRRHRVSTWVCALAIVGCTTKDGRTTGGTYTTGIGVDSVGSDATGLSVGDDGSGDDGSGGDTAATAADDEGPKFDVAIGDFGGVGEGGGCDTDECQCTIPDHVPCDMGSGDPFHAIGLNCPGEPQVQATTMGPPSAIGVRTGFGGNGTFAPREGSLFAVISSGFITDLDLETPPGDWDDFPTNCNDDIGAFDPGALPAPLKSNDVAGDCVATPALIGTGDCSNTINGQFSQGGGAQDYVELRFELDVPVDVISFSYDFAFFSVEYPFYYGSQYNDMYVGWLDSEAWTGNISFDAMGNPISLNAGFLTFKDDAANTPEFDGTCMKQHAGTDWLTTTAGVVPGEHITVVFAIFDLSDSILDSVAFIDNFQWGCDPTGKPSTKPEG